MAEIGELSEETILTRADDALLITEWMNKLYQTETLAIWYFSSYWPEAIHI